MRIGELAQATGVDPETIRYYEKAGLLPSPMRGTNGYRIYGAEHLERLAFVRHCRALDIPLAEVRRLLEFLLHPETDCADVDRLIETQLERVRARLASLQVLERQLSALRGRCADGRLAGDCGILRELLAVAQEEVHPKRS